MITFSNPEYLLLAVPLLFLVLIFFRIQKKAASRISNLTGRRFRNKLSQFTHRRYLVIYAAGLYICGLLLVLAVAGPEKNDYIASEGGSSVLIFLVDASFSMNLADIPKLPEEFGPEVNGKNRLRTASLIIGEIITARPDYSYGLISFSGKPVIHCPPVKDPETVSFFASKLNNHSYIKSGTDFNAALESVLYLLRKWEGDACQVLLISDGEEVNGDDLSQTFSVLKKRRIPVHTLLMGSREALALELYRPEDILARVLNPQVAKTVTSRREASVLRKISSRTGGSFFDILGLKRMDSLLDRIDGTKEKNTGSIKSNTDISIYFVLLWALFFFGDILYPRLLSVLKEYLAGVKKKNGIS